MHNFSEVLDTEEFCIECQNKIIDAQEEKKDMIFDLGRGARINEQLDTQGSIILE